MASLCGAAPCPTRTAGKAQPRCCSAPGDTRFPPAPPLPTTGALPAPGLQTLSGPPPPRRAVTPTLIATRASALTPLPGGATTPQAERLPRSRPAAMADCGPGASRAVRCGGGGPARRARCGPGAVVRAGRHFAGSVGPPVRVTLRHGERLRLRLRLRLRRRGWRWGEAGPGAHHGAGEGADRRGQRAGALAGQEGPRGAGGGCPWRGGGAAVPLSLRGAGRGTRRRPVLPARPGPARRLAPAAARGPSHGLSPQRMTDKCFRKCIGKPGGALDNSEQVSAVGGTRGPASLPTAASAEGSLSRRSASPCAWTGIWTPGTRFPEPTTLGCSAREPTCEAPRAPGRGRDRVGKGRAAGPAGWGQSSAAFPAPAVAEQ